jgi:hypothetical protein
MAVLNLFESLEEMTMVLSSFLREAASYKQALHPTQKLLRGFRLADFLRYVLKEK